MQLKIFREQGAHILLSGSPEVSVLSLEITKRNRNPPLTSVSRFVQKHGVLEEERKVLSQLV